MTHDNELTVYLDKIEFLYDCGTYVDGDTYLITYTPTSWGFATPTIETFFQDCNKYATTIGTIDYGSGDFVLEFATELGTFTGITWVINTDIFNVDLNTDYTNIITRIRSRGKDQCGRDMFSDVSDFTYSLTVSTIGDTYLRSNATAGADKIYVFDNTHLTKQYGVSDYYLVVGATENRELLVISATGSDGECSISGVTSYAHSKLEPVMCVGSIFATGSEDDVNNFISTLESISSLGVIVGSEFVYLNLSGTKYATLSPTTVQLYMDPTNRMTSIACPHFPDTKVYPALYVPYPVANTNSLVSQYGRKDGIVSPIGVIDNDTLDKTCINALKYATQKVTFGRFMLPINCLPASVGLYDWVYISEADLSATYLLQIVGIEFDGYKNMYYIDVGYIEDYYLESVAKSQNTFDMSLSSY